MPYKQPPEGFDHQDFCLQLRTTRGATFKEPARFTYDPVRHDYVVWFLQSMGYAVQYCGPGDLLIVPNTPIQMLERRFKPLGPEWDAGDNFAVRLAAGIVAEIEGEKT